MSAIGTKRTCRFALQMSAFDPKRTYALIKYTAAFKGSTAILGRNNAVHVSKSLSKCGVSK